MKVRDILRALKADGWKLVRQRGSHHHFMHATKPGIVTLAYAQEGQDIPRRTANAIARQAGWKTAG